MYQQHNGVILNLVISQCFVVFQRRVVEYQAQVLHRHLVDVDNLVLDLSHRVWGFSIQEHSLVGTLDPNVDALHEINLLTTTMTPTTLHNTHLSPHNFTTIVSTAMHKQQSHHHYIIPFTQNQSSNKPQNYCPLYPWKSGPHGMAWILHLGQNFVLKFLFLQLNFKVDFWCEPSITRLHLHHFPCPQDSINTHAKGASTSYWRVSKNFSAATTSTT